MPMHLRVQRGPNAGALFALRPGANTIGRSGTSTIALSDDKVSTTHAQIEVDAAGCALCDLDSTNGTFLNDKPLGEPARLHPGDRIQIGNSELLYDEGEMVAERPGGRIRVVVEEDESRPQVAVAWSPEETTQILPPPERDLGASELRHLYAVLAALYRVTSLVSRSGSLDELLENVLGILFDIMPADRGSVLFADGAAKALSPRAARCRSAEDHTIEVSETIVREVTESGRGVLTRDAAADERFRTGDSIQLFGIRSALCAPIRTPRQLFGVIYLDTRSAYRQFTERDLELLTAIGAEVGLSVENFRLVQQNLEAERLAAIGHAVAGLSHYIKNIVQSMEAARFLIETAIRDDDKAALEEAWRALDRNTELIAELVLNMLSYSKKAESRYESASANAIAREVVETLTQRASEQGVSFELCLDEAMPRALLDTVGVRRALLNLLTNAIDATGQGTIRVATRWDPHRRRAQLSVRDQGPGIPPELHGSIFEAFFTTKGAQGTGLGLAVTKKLVEELGGRIEVESAPGQGATFTIALPVHPDTSAADD